jgi:hypothetical protein
LRNAATENVKEYKWNDFSEAFAKDMRKCKQPLSTDYADYTVFILVRAIRVIRA